MSDTTRVTRIIDSPYAIPDVVEEIREAIDGAYEAAEDYHPAGVKVSVMIWARGAPRPNP